VRENRIAISHDWESPARVRLFGGWYQTPFWGSIGMIEDISAGLDAVPVTVVIGDRDQVEHEAALRALWPSLTNRYHKSGT
jgi:hypothetical protein